MNKEFKTTDELIQILKNKNMNFSQPIRAKRLLEENNFYVLSAYRHVLYNENNTYKENVDFEHLICISEFDKKFKTTILKHLLAIEQKIKTSISDQISSKYGIKQNDYLNIINYDQTNPRLNDTINNVKNQIRIYGSKNKAVRHYEKKYNYTPFWVVSKCLTMGCIRDYYNILKPDDQDIIALKVFTKHITKKRVNKLKNIIALLTDIRNMCAHDEILLGFVHNRIDVGFFNEHSFLNIKRNSQNEPIQGRKDILALFISIKYLVNKTMFNEFMQEITSCINRFTRQLSNVTTTNELLNYIGLPSNYEVLKTL